MCLAQVAGALDAAHRRALVHRDVKPANVLIDESGHAYLTDFGITKQLGGESTDTGRLVGTLDYLAPEQIRGDPVDGRTDVYALGCLLYECLSGAPPFRRATEAETLWAHMQEEPPSLKGHAALDPVLRKALAKDREDRFKTCAELIEAAAPALGLRPAARAARAGRAAAPRRARLLAAGLLLLAAVDRDRDRRPHRRRRHRCRAARERSGRDRPADGDVTSVHRVAHAAGQRRRGRGRGLDAEQRGADRVSHRPGDEGGLGDVRHARCAE